MKTITTRRAFVGGAVALFAAVGKALGRSLRRLVPNRQEQRAADKGRQLGVGTVTLKGPAAGSGFGAGTTWIGTERRGITRQNGVTKRNQNVLALSSGIPLSFGK